jgi:cell division protein FtsB
MERRRIPKLSRMQWVAIGLFIVFAVLLMDLNSRLTTLSGLNEKKQTVAVQVYDLDSTKEVLETQIAFATSEAAVEEAARVEFGWAKSGDEVVIPLPLPNLTPQVEATPTPKPTAIPNWQIWMALFSGH